MIGNWKKWEPPTEVPEPYEGHILDDQPPHTTYLRLQPHLQHGVLTAEFLARDGPFTPDGGLMQPPLGDGGVLDGLRSTMPHMPFT